MNTFPTIALRASLLLVLLIASQSAHAGDTRLSISGDRILINDRAVKILGLRCSNALQSDASTMT